MHVIATGVLLIAMEIYLLVNKAEIIVINHRNHSRFTTALRKGSHTHTHIHNLNALLLLFIQSILSRINRSVFNPLPLTEFGQLHVRMLHACIHMLYTYILFTHWPISLPYQNHSNVLSRATGLHGNLHDNGKLILHNNFVVCT